MGRMMWNCDFEKNIRKAIQPQMERIADDYQQMTERVGRQYAGRPVEEVKPALQREWRQIGGDITDPELTEYAEILRGGGTIGFRA